MDASQEKDEKEDENMEEAETRKRKAGDAILQPAARQPWLPKNAKRVENDGRGDCLFHAIAQSLNRTETGSSSRSHRQVRTTCRNVAPGRATYRGFCFGQRAEKKDTDLALRKR